MKSFLRIAASAVFSLMLISGLSISMTGCSADTLSGPTLDAQTTERGGGTSGGGSEHNLDKTDRGGGTSGGGSEHNL